MDIANFKNFMSTEDRQTVLDLLTKLQDKFEDKGMSASTPGSANYFFGVTDGINHCMKVLNGIDDDYLDGI